MLLVGREDVLLVGRAGVLLVAREGVLLVDLLVRLQSPYATPGSLNERGLVYPATPCPDSHRNSNYCCCCDCGCCCGCYQGINLIQQHPPYCHP